MLRTKLAKKVLTKKEQQHLTKAADVHSMATFLEVRKYQKENEGKENNPWETCQECLQIARKLGLEK